MCKVCPVYVKCMFRDDSPFTDFKEKQSYTARQNHDQRLPIV